MNPKQLMKQVQQMQAQMQQRMTDLRAEGSAGGGMVKAVVNGHKELQSIAIEKEAVDPSDVEMLQDLVVAAVHDANRTAQEKQSESMGGLTGGIDLSAFGLGAGDNPVFRGVWEAAQLVAAGSLLAADLVMRGEAERVFHFAGGLHHAMRERASGFCYVNDAVLAILRLRERGLRVAYVDIDAHHGDGVQYAFYGDPHVLTISTHERGERLFPGTGFVHEKGEGDAAGFSVNLPLEAYTDTEVYLPAFEAVVPPLLERFKPDVIVAQLGIDSHRTDPLTHLALDVQGFARALQRIVPLAPRLIALGGGGYDLRNVARAWTVAWAVLNQVELPARLPEAFEDDAQRYGFTSRDLWDTPATLPAEIGRAVREYADRQVGAVQTTIFPHHGL